jgi:hypothetical protein
MGRDFDPKRRLTRHLFGIEFHAPMLVPEAENDVHKPISDNLKKLAAETGAVTIDPFETMCTNGLCLTADDLGRPAYKDTGHLRSDWSREKATFIDQVFD